MINYWAIWCSCRKIPELNAADDNRRWSLPRTTTVERQSAAVAGYEMGITFALLEQDLAPPLALSDRAYCRQRY